MQTGIVDVDGKKRYFADTTGQEKNGWVETEGHFYYFDEKSGMATGLKK